MQRNIEQSIAVGVRVKSTVRGSFRYIEVHVIGGWLRWPNSYPEPPLRRIASDVYVGCDAAQRWFGVWVLCFTSPQRFRI